MWLISESEALEPHGLRIQLSLAILQGCPSGLDLSGAFLKSKRCSSK
jgi:hypothetical protein